MAVPVLSYTVNFYTNTNETKKVAVWINICLWLPTLFLKDTTRVIPADPLGYLDYVLAWRKAWQDQQRVWKFSSRHS